MKDLLAAQKEKEEELQEFQKRELELRRQKRELEDIARKTQIEADRRIDIAKKEMIEQLKKESDEEYRLKLLEKDKQMEQLTKTIQDLKRQSEQGSMQIQGDAAETDLKLLLQTNFPTDTVTDVPTGIKGADLVQTVKTQFGQTSGVLLWECKNTKGFNQEWLKKLKDDQVQAKADICVLVTKTLPENIKHFGNIDGVWVVESTYVLALTNALRIHMISLSKMKQSLVGSGQKMEFLYNYLLSSEFKNKIETIINAFSSLKNDLEAEKRAMNKIWSKREKELERVVTSTSSLYGDLQGATGETLPKIQSLELGDGSEETKSENTDPNVELF
jgi:hypothetical protein